MPGSDRSPVPKFGSFKPKRSANATAPSQNAGNNRHDGRPVKLGNHRVEKPKSHRDRHHNTSLPLRQLYQYRPAATQKHARKHGHQHNQHRNDPYRGYAAYRERSHESDCDRNNHHYNHVANRENATQYGQPRGETPSHRFADIFVIDTKGDGANLKYRRPNKWAVPLYHLYGSGSIVGHDPDIKIDRWLSDESGYTLRYPKEKRPVKRFEPIELDGMFDAAPGVPVDGEESPESDVHTSSEDGAQAVEMDFVTLPDQEKDEAPRLPIVTPKV